MATENLTAEPRLGSRYALALLPWRGGGGGDLPDRELALDGLVVDRGRLADYARVCGFPLDGRLPATFPQVLSFGPQVQLMTEPGFPLRLPGLVTCASASRCAVRSVPTSRSTYGFEPLTCGRTPRERRWTCSPR